MNFKKKNNQKSISKALAMGIIATSFMPVVAPKERVGAEPVIKEDTSAQSTKLVQVTCSALNIRTGSSTKYSIAGTVTNGTKLKYISTCSSGWYKVEYKGNERYISNKYSKIITSSTTSSSTSNSTETGNSISKVGKVTASSLNVRTGAGSNYSVKNTIKKNSVVGVLNIYSGWVKVQLSNSSTGYVSSKYLNIYSGDSSDIKVSQTTSSSSSSTSSTNSKIDTVLSTVKAQLGKPYVYGAAGPNCFDCSGLTYYSYKKAGIYLNRSSRDQAKNGRYVSKSELKPGDLIFFNSGTSTIRHVGIYVGDGQFIHSPSSGKTVRYQNLNSSYYTKGYVTARRIIE